MSLDEKQREELAKRIKEQRRAIWKGEINYKRQDKSQNHKNTVQIWKHQRKINKQRENHEKLYYEIDEEPISVSEEEEQIPELEYIIDKQTSSNKNMHIERDRIDETTDQITQDEPNTKKNRRRFKFISFTPPNLLTSLLVIIILIVLIVMGVAIGYILAVKDLINI
jgi:hypothetical protein